MTSWKPDLTRYGGHPAEALAEAIADAIASGALASGARLPTHRELAADLGLAVATVSKAYSIVGRRNLITGEVGRGTFVSTGPRWPTLTDPDGSGSNTVDLRVCMPPPVAQDVVLAAAIEGVIKAGGAKSFLRYPLPGGSPAQKAAGATWLARLWPDVRGEETLVTAGGHQAIAVALGTVAAPGDTVLCEPLTYAGIGQLAQVMGFKVRGVDVDDDGPLPEAVVEAADRYGASVLFVQPTLQNPLAYTMSQRRRDQLAEACARRNIWVIEDGVVADLLDAPPRSICARIPDQTLLLTSLSKSVCVSLRVGFLRCPAVRVSRAEKTLQSLALANGPLIAEVGAHLITSGRADELRHKIAAELEARHRLVKQIFADLPYRGDAQSPHLWVPVGDAAALPDIVAALARQGIWVATTRDFAISHEGGEPGLRLALGATSHRHKIADACLAVRQLLVSPARAVGGIV